MEFTQPKFKQAWYAVAFLAVWTGSACSARAVSFQLVKSIDTASLGLGTPGSIAAYGDDLYVGNLFTTAKLHHLADPLGVPTKVATFGGLGDVFSPTSNGYTSLSTDGTTLVAATSNGGRNPFDQFQVYAFGTDQLRYDGDSSSLAIGGNRIDGAAVNPITGTITLVAFGSDKQHIFRPDDPTPPDDSEPNLFFDSEGKTGWRDIEFDNTTGNVFLRSTNGVARGNRTANDFYVNLDGETEGLQTIVNLTDELQAAIQVEFIPASEAGQELVILNRRSNPNTFADQVLVYRADAVNQPVAVEFFQADGVTPFSTSSANSGIYDFSFDPVHELLYISDFSANRIYAFDAMTSRAEDLNGDGAIDAADAGVMFGNWGNSGVGDLNADQIVDAADAGMLFGAWTGDAGPTFSVPEPSLGGVAAGCWFAALSLLPRSRRRCCLDLVRNAS